MNSVIMQYYNRVSFTTIVDENLSDELLSYVSFIIKAKLH